MTTPRIAVSITAHEEAGVLLDQLRNILLHLEAPMVVVHLNRQFAARLEATEEGPRLLRHMASLPGVTLNPERLETQWARMFHAHLSNLRLLLDEPGWTHALLLSSADLFFRVGAETLVEGRRMGMGNPHRVFRGGQPADGRGNYWGAALEADASLHAFLASEGLPFLMQAAHEGTFYARELLADMVPRLLRAGFGEDPGRGWPAEEFLLPSLAQRHLQEAAQPGLAHRLVSNLAADDDRRAAAQLLRHHGLDAPEVNPALSCWVAEALGSPGRDMLEGRVIVSRLPRWAGHPLRRILAAVPEPGGGAAREAAARLRPLDLLLLERPGAGAVLHQALPVLPATEAAVLSAPRLPVFWPRLWAGCQPVACILPPCSQGYLHGSMPWPSLPLQVSAAFLPAEVRLELVPQPLGLGVTLEGGGTAPPGGEAPFVMLFTSLRGFEPARHAAMMLSLEAAEGAAEQIAAVLEWHHPGGKAMWPIGRLLQLPAQGRLRRLVLAFPPELLGYPAPKDGVAHIYLRLPVGMPPILLRDLELLG